MSCFCGLCWWALGALAVMWVLLRLRVLPVAVMRGWFAAVLLLNIIATGFFTWVADLPRAAGLLSSVTTQRLCTYVCVVTFRCITFFNPHIQVRVREVGGCKWRDMPGPSALVLNHTSFWDAFQFVSLSPLATIHNTRTLMKSSLRRLPIFGGVFDRVGHFPVYFTSDASGNFSVDKERQAAVQERVAAHLARGGRIALFPEGAVNTMVPPTTLQTFRFGTFSTILAHKLPTYFMLMVGNHETWPAAAPIGGFPATIDIVIGKVDVDYEREDARALAARMQALMQKELDVIYAARGVVASAVSAAPAPPKDKSA